LVVRVPTKIPGFDRLIEGGLVEHSVNLITGGPGTGKSLFCLNFVKNQIDAGNRCLYVTFEESLQGLLDDSLEFGWDFATAEAKKKCFFISFEPVSGPSTFEHLAQVIKKSGITAVVIDSVSVMAMAFQHNYYKMRKELYTLCNLLRNLNCTTLFTAEIVQEGENGGGALSRDGVVEFIADSVITMHNSGLGGDGDRALRVLKMRRTNHIKGPQPLSITKKGLKITKPSF